MVEKYDVKKSDTIFVAGGATGMVGTAIVECLQKKGYQNILAPSRSELDLLDQKAVENYLKKFQPEIVIDAAAKVGGIKANMDYPAEFIYDNLQIQTNLIHFSYLSGVKKFVFLGSSCVYPKDCPQPMKEEYFLTGPFEETNKAYAVAKAAGIQMIQSYRQQYGVDYISVMPTNLFGERDNFDLETSHVIPALIHKLHLAKINKQPTVEIWGSGKAKREFMYVKDAAEAIVLCMESYSADEIINIGSDDEYSISEIAHLIKEVVGFEGELIFDQSKPEGVSRKKLELSKIKNINIELQFNIVDSLKSTLNWFSTHNLN